MSSKEYREPEVEPQTPEEVEEVSPQDDASDPENQEPDGHQDGASGKPMTMEERREKMRQLRAKMVRRDYRVLSGHLLNANGTAPASVCTRESCRCD
jgi:hypothetical protein